MYRKLVVLIGDIRSRLALKPVSQAVITATVIVIITLFAAAYNFLLFHTIVEIAGIVVSCCISIIAWNSRRLVSNGYLLFIGIAFLFVSFLDLIHLLAYKNMGVFPAVSPNVSTQFWIAGRYLQAFSLLIAPTFFRRKINVTAIAVAYLIFVVSITYFIFCGLFPPCYAEGIGLTTFKKSSEFIIAVLFAGSIFTLVQKRQEFHREVFHLIAASIAVSIISEISFSHYFTVFDLSNIAGHLFKIAAVYLLYKAVVETCLARPQNFLFHELKRSQEALLESRELLRSIVEGTSDPIFVKDLEGRYILVNPAAVKVTGKAEGEVIGRDDTFIFPEQEARAIMAADRKMAEEGTLITCEESLTDAAGDRRFFLVTKGVLRNASGSITGIFGIARDISERKRTEQKLKESEDHFASAFRSAPIAYSIVSTTDERYLAVNEAFETLFGYRQEEIVGHTSLELHLWELPQERAHILAALQEHGSVRNVEARFRGKKSESIAALFSAERITIGGAPFILCIFDDITDRKAAEERIEILHTDLAARAAELEEANNDLEAFNHTVSHDLRRPLTNINGYCQVLLDLCAESLNDQCKSYLKEIYNSTLRMNSLIDTLINFSRINRRQVQVQTVNLSLLANSIANELKSVEPDRSVSIVIQEGLTATGDPDLLRVLLENLLSNSWKYTSKKKDAHIEFGSRLVKGKDSFFVSDDGAGFDREKATLLFTPFQRLHTTKDFEGHGIGLATVKRIVERHGGHVWAEGELGLGATFYFTLPEASPNYAKHGYTPVSVSRNPQA